MSTSALELALRGERRLLRRSQLQHRYGMTAASAITFKEYQAAREYVDDILKGLDGTPCAHVWVVINPPMRGENGFCWHCGEIRHGE